MSHFWCAAGPLQDLVSDSFPSLRILLLPHNKLEGPIPMSFASIHVLDLSGTPGLVRTTDEALPVAWDTSRPLAFGDHHGVCYMSRPDFGNGTRHLLIKV